MIKFKLPNSGAFCLLIIHIIYYFRNKIDDSLGIFNPNCENYSHNKPAQKTMIIAVQVVPF